MESHAHEKIRALAYRSIGDILLRAGHLDGVPDLLCAVSVPLSTHEESINHSIVLYNLHPNSVTRCIKSQPSEYEHGVIVYCR